MDPRCRRARDIEQCLSPTGADPARSLISLYDRPSALAWLQTLLAKLSVSGRDEGAIRFLETVIGQVEEAGFWRLAVWGW